MSARTPLRRSFAAEMGGARASRTGRSLAAELARAALEGARHELEELLPAGSSVEPIIRKVCHAIDRNEDLARATPSSVVREVLRALRLGLDVGGVGGQAYLVAREDEERGIVEAKLLIGYKGMIELARRSGIVIEARVVCRRDKFVHELGAKPRLEHKPTGRDRSDAAITHAYAIARFPDGRVLFEVLTRRDIDARRERSERAGDSAWSTDFAAMARKSAVRAIAAYLPQAPGLSAAVELDQRLELGKPSGYDAALDGEARGRAAADGTAGDARRISASIISALRSGRPAEAYQMLRGAEGELARARAALYGRARREPIALGDGTVFGEVEDQAAAVDGRIAYEVLANRAPEFLAAAFEFKTSRARLRAALKHVAKGARIAPLEREVLAQLDAGGALYTRTSRELREHRPSSSPAAP